MAWQQTDLDALRAAYINVASGAQKVRYADGREVTFTDPDKISAAIRVVEANLQMQERAAGGLTRRRFGAFRSGV